MRGVEKTFEVRIKDNGTPKLIHILAMTSRQAAKKARKRHVVTSVRKMDINRLYDISRLRLEEQTPEYVAGSPYPTAIAMDEMLWQKRNKRIDNQHKDKETP